MRILAVDYGDARTGLAICDRGELLASPIGVFHSGDREAVIKEITRQVAEQKAELVVVGNPLNMNGTAGPRSELCHALADDLAEKLPCPVRMWDERSTTVTATQYLNMTDVRGKKRKNTIDAVAATIILESYLAYRKTTPGRNEAMPHTEELLQRETLSENRVFAHERRMVRLENGATAERELIRHPGGVGIVAVDENDRLLMVRQYRSGMGHESLEIPAGKRDAGEVPEVCGRRELEEECGLIAGRLELLATLYPTPAYCDERIWIFTAGALTAGHTHPDEDEFITVEWVPLAEAERMVLAGEIEDAKTQIAILKYTALRRKGELHE